MTASKITGDTPILQDNVDIDALISGESAFTEKVFYTYLKNLVDSTDPASPLAYHVAHAFDVLFQNSGLQGFAKTRAAEVQNEDDDEEAKYKMVYTYKKHPQRNAVKPAHWKRIQKHCADSLANAPDVPMPAFYENLVRLGEYLGFSQSDAALLKFVYIAEADTRLNKFVSDVANSQPGVPALLTKMIGGEAQYRHLVNSLAPTGRLFKFGIIENVREYGQVIPKFDPVLAVSLQKPGLEKSDLIDRLLGKPAKTDLTLEDFSYLGSDLNYLTKILSEALARKEKGINILIYGAAGGGKTELSKALAASQDVSLYMVGEENEDESDVIEVPTFDDEGDISGSREIGGANVSSSKARLAALHRAQGLLEGNPNALVLFDEIEDLLIKGSDSSKSPDVESKIGLNRLLENNPIPMIWCGNDPEKFHQAVRQRFTFSLFVGDMPVLIRQKIWKKQCELQGYELPEEDINLIARRYDAAPRQITQAVRCAKLTGGGVKAIERVLSASSKIADGSRESIIDDFAVNKYFDRGLLNIDASKSPQPFDIDTLAARGAAHKPFSLYASGARGTGVQSLAYHLAEEMVMTPYIAEMKYIREPSAMATPEDKLVSAFTKAVDSRAFLIVPDIEALSHNPRDGKSWEGSLFETFIKCARTHSLPFFVGSQMKEIVLPERLTRLFSDRVELKPLNDAQKARAFKVYFGQAAPKSIATAGELTIGAFADVRHMLERMDADNIYPDQVVEMLKVAQSSLSEQPSSIGFGANILSSGTGRADLRLVAQAGTPQDATPIGKTLC
ncbi:MAG: AAA family ATPase [Pseudobdellovibrionaceae bacterium]